MKIEKILGNIQDFPIGDRKIETVAIEWFELEKKLLRKTSETGEEIGIRVDTPLKDGDVLAEDEKRVLVIDTLPCELTVTPVSSMEEMGRLCFELGNRHLSLAISADRVAVPYDEPTFAYLKHIGFQPEKVKEKFTHFTVCHAHGHSHTQQTEHTHTHEQIQEQE
ncbi:MAG: urease accessory protein UreE [Lachnospiraceae bacterium]